jgi:outer membrane protein OmpA-like peptidoglycan-associated protein
MAWSHDRNRRRPLVAVAAALGIGGLTACSYTPPPLPVTTIADPCLQAASGPLVIAVGNHANQPTPTLPADVQEALLRAAYHGRPISIVRVDGAPTSLGTETFRSDAKNDERFRQDLADFLGGVAGAAANAKAVKPEADPLDAIALAADAAGTGGTVILIDSGLQTVAPLDFDQPGLIDADPADIADFLSSTNELPHLAGDRFITVGIGYTAPPQAGLTIADRDNLTAIWAAIAAKAGAECEGAIAGGGSDAATKGLPAVTPIAIVPPTNPTLPAPTSCQPVSIRDSGVLRFQPDLARFVDASGAKSALQQLADEISGQRLTVTLTGTTSSAGGDGSNDASRVKLSVDRANAVRAVLIADGVPAASITTRGAGDVFDGFVTDRDGNGDLIPALAARNRQVIVIKKGCQVPS